MNAAAVIVPRQRRAVERFRANRCVNPEAACTLEELGIRRNYGVNSLIRRGILRPNAIERYWLDEHLWREFQKARRTAVLILLAVGLVLFSENTTSDDPLAGLNFQDEDYTWATDKLLALAREACGGRLVSTLEGGYDLNALANSVAAHVASLMGAR